MLFINMNLKEDNLEKCKYCGMIRLGRALVYFGGENEDIRPKNTYYWDIKL